MTDIQPNSLHTFLSDIIKINSVQFTSELFSYLITIYSK